MNKECYGDMKKNELEKLPVVDEKFEMPSEGTYMQKEDIIKAYIFEVRGKQVILDFHLAKLYAVENRTLKQAVRRNVDRFPNDFMFRLTKDKTNNLISIGVSQSVIPPGYNSGSSRVFAVTEQGVSMLASVKDMGRGLCTVIRLGFSPEDVLSRL